MSPTHTATKRQTTTERETRIVGTATGEIVWVGKDASEDERTAWCEWLREHDIDPSEALGILEINRESRTIRYLAYDLTERGARFPRPDHEWASASMRETKLDRPISGLPEVDAP